MPDRRPGAGQPRPPLHATAPPGSSSSWNRATCTLPVFACPACLAGGSLPGSGEIFISHVVQWEWSGDLLRWRV